MVEHLVGIGWRIAEQRVAHFLLEIGARLARVGLATKEGYACPLSQYHLADAFGLRAAHVNRVLPRLREQGLATFPHSRVIIQDHCGLVVLAEFDSYQAA